MRLNPLIFSYILIIRFIRPSSEQIPRQGLLRNEEWQSLGLNGETVAGTQQSHTYSSHRKHSEENKIPSLMQSSKRTNKRLTVGLLMDRLPNVIMCRRESVVNQTRVNFLLEKAWVFRRH